MVQGATPYNWSNIYIRINGLGNSFAFGNQNYFGGNGNIYGTGSNTSFPNVSTVNTLPNGVPSSDINTGQYLYGMYARVKVCDATTSMGVSGLESNCVAYGSNYKPEGLIQKNALKLNFSAFSFLFQDDPNQSGGVMRARMAQLGPNKTSVASNGSTSVSTNPNPEWSASTGVFITNPVPSDASAYGGTGISNSGVINYLNKFGETAKAYMHYDETSELFYAVGRYFRNKGNYAPYSKKPNGSALDQSQYDGFPVITNWDDPIQNKCQKNFIIGIGDTHISYDGNLPGTDDTGVDAIGWTNYIGQAQGYTTYRNLGTAYTPWCCTGATFLMSGLAYNLHTVDQRPDIPGSQTVSTYWVDVLESGAVFGETLNIYDRKDQGEVGMRNQFWLTAKYGGFTGTPPTPGTSLAQSQWDTNNDDDPDTYYRANNPSLMINGLTTAFASIATAAKATSTALAVISPKVQQSGNTSYSTTYDPNYSIGDLVANLLSFNATTNQAMLSPQWSAQAKLETQAAVSGWDTRRFIATSTASNTTNPGVPFRIANINATQQATLGTTVTDQQNTLNFLRGDRSNAGTNGTAAYRDRNKLLGDIVNSKMSIVGAPAAGYADGFNPGYSSFATTYANRNTVVYVGANDGMMHAFDGSLTNTTAGQELFAYIPSVLFNGPSSPSTPPVDGLKALSNPNYAHHFYVDATPNVFDLDFNNTGGTTNPSPDWHSLLVGGLGKGGKAYYAVDVTNPANLSNETNLASAVKWEFTNANLGFSYGDPIVVKTKRYGWVVILTSGYNNADGRGYFFILNPKTGALLQTIQAYDQTSCTAASVTDSGLAAATAFVPDYTDFTSDAVYAGDLCGNLWRLDLTSTSSNYTPTIIAQFRSSLSAVQPVTVAPTVAVDPNTSKRYVFVGTGKILDTSDFNTAKEQTFYAIIDGTRTQFFTSSTLPSVSGMPLTYPVTRSNLYNNTTGTSGIVANVNTPLGWYIDLGFNTGATATANSVAYQYNVPAAITDGMIAFVTNSPVKVGATLDDAVCNPSGTNQTYALSFATGGSLLLNSNNASVKYVTNNGIATDINFIKVADKVTVQVGDTTGAISPVSGNF